MAPFPLSLDGDLDSIEILVCFMGPLCIYSWIVYIPDRLGSRPYGSLPLLYGFGLGFHRNPFVFHGSLVIIALDSMNPMWIEVESPWLPSLCLWMGTWIL